MKQEFVVNGKEIVIDNFKLAGDLINLNYEGREYTFNRHQLLKQSCADMNESSQVFCDGEVFEIAFKTLKKKKSGADDHHMISPMPGKIIKVMVSDGEKVEKGAPLLILEAMKMEHTIKAAIDGIVLKINFNVGEIVTGGVELVIMGDENVK